MIFYFKLYFRERVEAINTKFYGYVEIGSSFNSVFMSRLVIPYS